MFAQRFTSSQARGLTAVLIAATLAAGCSGGLGSDGGNDGGTVIAYNSPDEWANYRAIRAAFQDESGIHVPSDTKNSGQALAAIENEAGRPQADTGYWGITFGIDATDLGLLEPYAASDVDQVDAALRHPDDYWTPIHYGVVAFLVNTDALGDIAPPTSWADLLKPEYAGKVFYADPASAAIGYFSAAAANQAMGGDPTDWEPGLSYLEELAETGAVHPTNTTPAKVASGEYAILIDADFNGYIQRHENGAPVETIIPSDGTIMVPYSVGLVKDGPNPEGAREWIDFLISDRGQELFAQAYVHPVRGEIPAEIRENMAPEADYEAIVDVPYIDLAESFTPFIAEFSSRLGR